MAKFETEDQGSFAYLLSEDGELRLRKLYQHVELLARLSEPRMGEQENGPPIDTPALSSYFEMLAEQVQLVMNEVSEPGSLHRQGVTAAATEETEDGDNAGSSDAAMPLVPDEPGASVADDYAFGVTLDQLDEMNRLLDQLTAQGDLLMASEGGELAQGTLIVTGTTIFNDADAAHTIMRQVGSQPLDEVPAPGLRVREVPALYNVHAGGAAKRQGSDLH
ncbi:hypothetical protein [Luteimonas sp. FCS-9]|uniref:XAC0095 family protein n=1 Tax=Luteimonas sp. FCS-9 TaxID=1547516 RepID=UPI000B13570B|nr:hypothetical protein [Luteimonas sp. FCS-9]